MADLSGIDLCSIRVGMPPEGEVPNFADPPSLVPTIIPVCTVMMTLALLVTAGRLFVNRKQLGWSDFITATLFSKASIFLLFHQIFTMERHMQIAIWAGLAVSFAVFLPSVGYQVYTLTPNPGETCDDLALSGKSEQGGAVWSIVGSVLNLMLDVYIFLLPLPIIAKLNWSTRKRLKASAVFSTGVLIRMAKDLADKSWKAAVVLLCFTVEVHITIMVSSMPGFSKFVRVYTTCRAPASNQCPGNGCDRNKPRTGRERYPELGEPWLFKTNATVEAKAEESDGGVTELQPTADLGVMQTLDVEQAISRPLPANVKIVRGIQGCDVFDKQRMEWK
ncbi:hypothetical protein C8A03DRAFT_12189 [Achaetomium macrosporum]|uniref:Rhodopsin domain-containing protein n=1 Tax=Achaetomium macrosporum TaxID=79813 RepID=A0AAN7CGE8_9PEZI|nr:hypothetical protein C8A03DRAFT_12189 [Achaetomium macrosporum]